MTKTANTPDIDWTHVSIPPPSPVKVPMAMRIDADVLAWFRDQGPGHQTRINHVLRSYYEAMRGRTRSAP
jgi:uncharacterized protein (DUF4415 family)